MQNISNYTAGWLFTLSGRDPVGFHFSSFKTKVTPPNVLVPWSSLLACTTDMHSHFSSPLHNWEIGIEEGGYCAWLIKLKRSNHDIKTTSRMGKVMFKYLNQIHQRCSEFTTSIFFDFFYNIFATIYWIKWNKELLNQIRRQTETVRLLRQKSNCCNWYWSVAWLFSTPCASCVSQQSVQNYKLAYFIFCTCWP